MKNYINDDSNIEKIYQIFRHIFDNEENYDINELKSLFLNKFFINIEKSYTFNMWN